MNKIDKLIIAILAITFSVGLGYGIKNVFANGTLATTFENFGSAELGNKVKKVSMAWAVNSTGFTTQTLPGDVNDGMGSKFRGYVIRAVMNPSATPTDNYDVELRDEDGVDVFGGELYNLDQTNSEQRIPATGATYVHSPLSLYITNATKSGAGGVLDVYIAE